MFFGDRQDVGFEGGHVSLNGFLDVGEGGILSFALGDAAREAGAVSDPEAIFPVIVESLSRTVAEWLRAGHGSRSIGVCTLPFRRATCFVRSVYP